MNILNDKNDFTEFKKILTQNISLNYKICKIYECLDYFSEHGIEYVMSENGMSERTILIKELSYQFSRKLTECFNTNNYKLFSNYWYQIRPFIIN